MRLQQISIKHVRNLNDIHINFSPGLNIFFGKNASGKTSLLESLYLLSCAKSFRSHHFKNIVSTHASYCRITGKIVNENAEVTQVGVEFREGRLRMRALGKELKKTSELAQYLPIIIIHQECQRLLTDGPKLRRKFLDWGVFHVERDFLKVWRQYSRALKQRNMILHARKGSVAINAWNNELKDTALAIHAYRQSYCDVFIPQLRQCLEQLFSCKNTLNISYQAGWDNTQDFISVLENNLEQDLRRGYTRQGPHRADLVLRVNNITAHETLSRGQQKLVICAMLIAQAMVYQQWRGISCLFLVDDLKAELDHEHVARVMGLLKSLDTQLIMTATEQGILEPYGFNGYKTFHVKRGHVMEMV